MTPKESTSVFTIQNIYTNNNPSSYRSRSPYRRTDPDNKESSQFNKFCTYCRKNGHSISRCFKRQTNKYREMNEKAKQNYANNRQQQSTQKLFRDFLKNNQDLPNQKAPTTYVSPHRNHYQNQSRSPHNARYHTSPYRRPRENSFSPHRHN